jgi:hypothetical protein
MQKRHLLTLIVILFLNACGPAVQAGSGTASINPVTPTPFQPLFVPSPTATPTPSLWLAPSVPNSLRDQVAAWGLPFDSSPDQAAIHLDLATPTGDAPATTWVYTLVAAFPTLTDGVSTDDVQAAWGGDPSGAFSGHKLIVEPSTLATFTTLWGRPDPNTVSAIGGDWVEALWSDRSLWAIIPFEEISPPLKVLTIDGQSPIRKQFDLAKYPLKASFACSGQECADPGWTLPVSNYDPSKLATVVMTGVTALVRATAYKMEQKGVTYPGQDIRNWLQEADIAHISNEIPFAVGCPYPDPNQGRLIFCSDPKYIDLLDYVGADVIELTGNHFEDWGPDATRYTIQMYKDRGWQYYGGGLDLADSQKPAKFEVNGNKIAFIGCNPVGPDFAWAREDNWPGAAPCGDNQWMIDSIKQLTAEGYQVIATFQHFEYYSPEPRPQQKRDFEAMAQAGAVVVSGSQGHYAQAMEFDGSTFIHYGLGNLFFDQMNYIMSDGTITQDTRREFLDRHVFYNGHYINTELLTAQLEEFARPRPMTPEERAAFLTEYFTASGWLP